jgi:hypothetical protein
LIWAVPLQALLLFHHLDLLYPWGDEWFTLTTAPRSLHQISPLVAGEAHPPLYYFLLHFWIQIPWPGSPLTKMRAMSAIWALLATAIFYRLWLRAENLRTQRMFLALWVASPCLLLYGRMARSYSMQLALALLTIYAAVEWMQRPNSAPRLLAYSCSLTALLYTHYLPGLAIAMAVSLSLLSERLLPVATRAMLLGASALLVMLLYLPWLTTMGRTIVGWSLTSPYRVGNIFVDQLVRLAYWFVSFTFGEVVSTTGMILGAALTPVLLYALYGAVRAAPSWLGLVAAASTIGYVGVSQWIGFSFTGSHVLFALPFFLMLLVMGIQSTYRRSSMIFACLLVVYVSADYCYFTKTGYLGKGLCAPYGEVAAVIRNRSPAEGAVVLDDDSLIPELLSDALGPEIRVIVPVSEQSAYKQLEDAGHRPTVIWFWRRTHDTSPSGWVSHLEKELSQGRVVRQYSYLPYTAPERWVLRVLRGPGQPSCYFSLSEIR